MKKDSSKAKVGGSNRRVALFSAIAGGLIAITVSAMAYQILTTVAVKTGYGESWYLTWKIILVSELLPFASVLLALSREAVIATSVILPLITVVVIVLGRDKIRARQAIGSALIVLVVAALSSLLLQPSNGRMWVVLSEMVLLPLTLAIGLKMVK